MIAVMQASCEIRSDPRPSEMHTDYRIGEAQTFGLEEMQKFVAASTSCSPNTKLIEGNIIRPMNSGKSGAHVFEMEHGRVLKLYPVCVDPSQFKSDFHFQRALRDIVMTCITPNSISPGVFDYGISHDMRPFLIMEKIDGIELFCYEPDGGRGDVELLFDIVQALRQFNASFRHFCLLYGVGMCRPCHRDLHPHNIIVTRHGVRFIDFELAVCPIETLRDSDSPQRQRALRHPWLQWILGNYSRSTEDYVHWTNVFDYVPMVVRNDSDLLQLYTIVRYFQRRNPSLRHMNRKLEQCTDRDDFLLIAHDALHELMQ